MGVGNHPPPPPFSGKCEVFSPCWCAVAGREKNPHCQGLVPGVSIESDLFTLLLIIAGILLVLHALKIINMRTIFKKVSTFLWGEKSFRWGELKGL